MPASCREAMRDPGLAQKPQELDRAWERPALGQQLTEELAVALLDLRPLRVRQPTADLSRNRAGEQPPLIPIRR